MKARQTNLRLGKELLSWVAPDYHPYERGLIWHIAFCFVMFGSAIFFLVWDPQWGWVSAFAFCFVAAVYFWIHKDDNAMHEINRVNKRRRAIRYLSNYAIFAVLISGFATVAVLAAQGFQ